MNLLRIGFVVTFLGCGVLLASPAPAQVGGPAAPAALRLSRREAIAEALARNPGLLASKEQVEQARAQVVIDTAFPDPTLAADVAGQSKALNPGSGNASDVGFGLTFPFPGKRRLRGEVARAALSAAEFTLAQLRQQVASQAAQAYDAILVALRHRDDLQAGQGAVARLPGQDPGAVPRRLGAQGGRRQGPGGRRRRRTTT